MRIVSAIILALLAVVFAVAATMLALFTIAGTTFLAYALVLVFVLGSVVSARWARDVFTRRARGRASA